MRLLYSFLPYSCVENSVAKIRKLFDLLNISGKSQHLGGRRSFVARDCNPLLRANFTKYFQAMQRFRIPWWYFCKSKKYNNYPPSTNSTIMITDAITKIELEKGLIHITIEDPDSCPELVKTIASLTDGLDARRISLMRECSDCSNRPFSFKSTQKETLIRVHSSSNKTNQTYQLFTLINTNIMLQLDNELMQSILDANAWQNLSSELSWSEALLEKCKDNVDWGEVSQNTSILWTIPMLQHFQKYINWDKLSEYINKDSLTPEMIEAFKDCWNWHELSDNCELNLTDDLLEKYADLWDWERIIDRNPRYSSDPFEVCPMEFYNKYKDHISAALLQGSNLWTYMQKQRQRELLNELLK